MATVNGTNYAKVVTGSSLLEAAQDFGKLRVFMDSKTFAGEAAGERVKIGKAPAGSYLMPHLSFIHAAALGGSVTLSVGDAATPAKYLALTAANTANLIIVLNVQAQCGEKFTTDTELYLTTAGAAATGSVKTYLVFAIE